MTLASSIAKRFQKDVERTGKRLDAYIANPNSEGNVHRMRTSLRRLDAVMLVLPKKARKANSESAEKYRQFFKVNSAMRDSDVVRNRIASMAKDDQDISTILTPLQRKRQSELAKALKIARILCILPKMKLDSKEITDKKIEARIDKILSRLFKKISKSIPEVLAEETKVEELHGLRKDFKKLRYVLDVVPRQLKMKYENNVTDIIGGEKKNALEKKQDNDSVDDRLKEIQDVLGLVHDSDITAGYLASIRKLESNAILDELLNKETASRKMLFQNFAQHMSNKK